MRVLIEDHKSHKPIIKFCKMIVADSVIIPNLFTKL